MGRFSKLAIQQVQVAHKHSPIEMLICEWRVETIQGLSGTIVSTCSPEHRLYNAALIMVSDCCFLPLAPGPGNICSGCGEWGFHRLDGSPAKPKVIRGTDVYSALNGSEENLWESELRAGKTFSNWLTAFLGDELEAALESTLLAHELVEEVLPALVTPEHIFPC